MKVSIKLRYKSIRHVSRCSLPMMSKGSPRLDKLVVSVEKPVIIKELAKYTVYPVFKSYLLVIPGALSILETFSGSS